MITTTTIFDKTAKGREEIATRQHRVPPRLRTLLLLVDGKRDVVELMAKVAGLGLDKNALGELLTGEFIQQTETLAASMLSHTAPPALPAEAAPQSKLSTILSAQLPSSTKADTATGITDNAASQTTVPDSTIDLGPTDSGGRLRSGESQFQAVTNFFTETIRSAIGLRGFAMQLRVERASTITELRALRDPYLEAVLKSKGPEMERSLRNRLDQLLALGD